MEPQVENTGPKARPAKTYIKNESRSVPGEPKRSQEDAKRAQQEPKRSQEEAKRTCAKPTFSGMGCRCVNCHDFGALGEGWEKFKMVQRLEGGLGRVRRQLSGGREEPKRSPRGVQEESKRAQEEPKRKARAQEDVDNIIFGKSPAAKKSSQEEAKRSP